MSRSFLCTWDGFGKIKMFSRITVANKCPAHSLQFIYLESELAHVQPRGVYLSFLLLVKFLDQRANMLWG